ncbi:AAA family ATPase [Prevotella histicola]|uniref:AAA family ATPase n=1 Tax=Prevotella histicola TaxID=470565 RepID=UPI001C5DDDDE|nr:AAA family ATPase [Prevotella histicola]MBW4775540.1 AAA family ATPase [Prevotella histicola]
MKRIVLTGGPCAGKTTALVKIIEHFSSLGYKVFIIPEVPTLFSQAGMDYLTDNSAFFYEGEKATLEMQIALEDKFTRIAETIGEPTIIVCDRGTMDISAYMKPEMWDEITAGVGTCSEKLRARYDAVLHLVSAADGAEQFYTTANNAERTEGLELAREVDKKVIQAWSEHPYLRVINNHENFDTKINRVIQEISNILEIPQQIVEERKYIVRLTGDIPDAIESEIIQTYLTSDPRSEVRLRRRTLNGVSVNVRTTKKTLANNAQVVTERQIDNNLYESLMRQADPYRQSIHKIRKTFIWRGQFFELDTYLSPMRNLQILETKGIVDHEDVNFPPFIEVVEDITGKTEYYNYNLALRK